MNKTLKRQHLYRTIWRWHFYAGIFCIPFIITLSISGAIYLFKPQIDDWLDKPFNQLTIEKTKTTPAEHIQTALNAVPNSIFLNYQLPPTEAHSVIISVIKEGERHLVYINPYSLEVLKTTKYNQQFIRLVRTFHGELLSGNVGSVLVELAGCWAIVLIITGLYLWWPRSAKGLAGVFYPRFHKGKRIFWRDLHATIGIWISFFTLFLLISGLPWALVWGSAFKEIRQFSFENAASKSAISSSAHDHNTMEKMDDFTPDWSTGRASEAHLLTNSEGVLKRNLKLSSAVMTTAYSLNFSSPAELSLSKEGDSTWKLASQHQNRMLRATAWIDGSTGLVKKIEHFSDKKILDKAIGIGVAAHEGQLFGWVNQLIGLLTTLGLMIMSISAFVLWRSRKPEKELGAPKKIPSAQVSHVIIAITLLLALFLPLLAISLIILSLLEYFLWPKIPSIQRWLGLHSI